MQNRVVFKVGDRVKLVKQRKYPGYNLVGLIGTVRTDSYSSISVIFDTIKNHSSSYGSFYFKPVDLVYADESRNESVKEKNMTNITNYLNIAKVDQDNNAVPYHVANFDPGLKKGDLCIVYRNDRFVVAKVVDILEQNDMNLHMEVVTKIYTDEYDARVECRKKAADLKSKMEARAKQLQDIAIYQMLAKDDPDMANLLQEYQSITAT